MSSTPIHCWRNYSSNHPQRAREAHLSLLTNGESPRRGSQQLKTFKGIPWAMENSLALQMGVTRPLQAETLDSNLIGDWQTSKWAKNMHHTITTRQGTHWAQLLTATSTMSWCGHKTWHRRQPELTTTDNHHVAPAACLGHTKHFNVLTLTI